MGAEEDLGVRGQRGGPEALTARLFRDMAGALELLTVYLGERLGLYQSLHAGSPATAAELAARTGTAERRKPAWRAASRSTSRTRPALGYPAGTTW